MSTIDKLQLSIGVFEYLLSIPTIDLSTTVCFSCKYLLFLSNIQISLLYPIEFEKLQFSSSPPIILHLGENFSNLSETSQIANFSSATGCAIIAAYVSPAQGIKPHIVHPNELYRAQATKDTEQVFTMTKLDSGNHSCKHICGICLWCEFFTSLSPSSWTSRIK